MPRDDEAHDHPDFDEGRGPMSDETAEWYVANYGDHPTNHRTVDFADLRPDDVVLDVGCGSGTAVREAAGRVPSGRVIGVDPTPAMIRIAKEQSVGDESEDRIEFHEATAEQLPLPEGTATVVLAVNSVHHWEDVDAGLAEVSRVLVPGGRFVIGDEDDPQGGDGVDTERLVPVLERAGYVEILSHHAEAGGEPMTLVTAVRP